MHESSRDEDTGAEVSHGEEESWGESYPRKVFRKGRERTRQSGDYQDDEDGTDLEGRVIFILARIATWTGRSAFVVDIGGLRLDRCCIGHDQ